ncbi:MAG: hypothetical protein EOP09_05505 [Proteobacteria bacterium]|nr:MAG: hypothetical protein EOP09_05505 [Pseudomonadota bacterium]
MLSAIVAAILSLRFPLEYALIAATLLGLAQAGWQWSRLPRNQRNVEIRILGVLIGPVSLGAFILCITSQMPYLFFYSWAGKIFAVQVFPCIVGGLWCARGFLQWVNPEAPTHDVPRAFLNGLSGAFPSRHPTVALTLNAVRLVFYSSWFFRVNRPYSMNSTSLMFIALTFITGLLLSFPGAHKSDSVRKAEAFFLIIAGLILAAFGFFGSHK